MIAVMLSFMALTTNAQSMPQSASPESRMLVVIGASYAADWGAPSISGYTVINKGVGGQTSTDVRKRFARDVIDQRPHSVLIWGHYNDIVRAPAGQIPEARARAQENLTAMADEARAAGIRPLLATEITMPLEEGWIASLMRLVGGVLGKEDYRVRINSHIRAVNEWLRSYAKQERLTLLDFEAALAESGESRRAEYALPDGSHVTPAGYAALTRYAASALVKN